MGRQALGNPVGFLRKQWAGRGICRNGRGDLGKRKVEGQTPRELVKELPASSKACGWFCAGSSAPSTEVWCAHGQIGAT